ncbi:GNAT family N-acetyltransferase [Terrarubrum flagellatum]|uniref:GNAT family N-acetyltransferase n=1 Tax=Terrirubrum flagellatum TaxID=2895980 RepID=UPI003144E1B4
MSVRFQIVANAEQRQQAYAIRAIVYVGEQNCPWDEEFDGNDDAATQILGLCDGEPFATARIRWFAEFAKLERLAIRQPYRHLGYGHELLDYLIALCREKGFRKAYLHAQSRLETFYRRHGFTSIGRPFGFSDHDYIEMVADLALNPAAISLEDGPMVINRPEGQWGQAGVLEHSLRRLANQKSPVFTPSFR